MRGQANNKVTYQRLTTINTKSAENVDMANLGIVLMQVLSGMTSIIPTIGIVVGLALFGLGVARNSASKGKQEPPSQ